MTDRREWDAAAEEFIARERERLGGPPTADQIAAYARGELSDHDAANVRALLVVHPEAAEALTRHVELDMEDVLSDDEMARDWASLQRRIAAEAVPDAVRLRPSYVSRTMPIAAMIAIAALGALLLHSRMTVRRLAEERDRPRIHVRHELLPAEHARGAATPVPYPLSREGGDYLLALLLYDDVDGLLRLDIVNTQGTRPRTIWSSRVSSEPDHTIDLSVPRAFLDPDTTYRLDLYRLGADRPVATYFVRVRAH
jgi:hypothetical protein